MDILKSYKFWTENEYFDHETRQELLEISDNKAEIEERFYKNLEFGTGGLRGIIGAGTNRINIYTVRKASQGLADYVKERGGEFLRKGIVIAYDSRYKSPDFALEAALTFAANGIKAYLFDELRPTPELSFAVRYLNAAAGIVITASHNPKEYNGYKVYGSDGAQISLEASNAVLSKIDAIEDITQIKLIDKEEAMEKGLLEYLGKDLDDAYINSLKTLSINTGDNIDRSIKIVFTPLHGTGNKLVRRVLKETGFDNVLVVKEQELPDPEFTTVKYPNPEDRDSFKLAIELAEKEKADLIIGTDPDCDRVGVLVKNQDGDYVVLTGNQTGCLLMEYLLSEMKKSSTLPENGFVVKTIVTTECARAIANNYNIPLLEVLTGFKFIGEKIKELDEFGEKKFLFGFEESYGYLAGSFARDKDGVVTCMLIAEMAGYFKSKGMTLYDALIKLYEKYGYYIEEISSFTLEGKVGMEKIINTMTALRENRRNSFGSCEILAVRDYLVGEKYSIESGRVSGLDLPKSNVIYYEMASGGWVAVRPSGTEPKIKIYFGESGKTESEAKDKLDTLKNCVVSEIQDYLGA